VLATPPFIPDDILLVDIPDEDLQKKEENREKLFRNGVFGGQLGREVDHISRILGREGQHQSDRDLPPLNFSQGITTRSKTTASEQQGIAFLTYLILCSTYALNKGGIEEKIGELKMAGYINVLEQLICLEEFMKTSRKTGIKRSNLPALQYYTSVLLDTIKQLVNRQQGDGFDTIKFHLITHMIGDDIRRFGSPANISGSAGECQFKTNFKLPASTGQLRDVKFDQQLYERRHQHMFINRCGQRVTRANGLAEHLVLDRPTIATSQANTDNEFSSQLFRGLKKTSTEKEGDIANSRYADGLSCAVYIVQMVKNKNDPTDEYHPNIVHCGKVGTLRHKLFYCKNTKLVGLDCKPTGTPNNRALKAFNLKFKILFHCFEKVFTIDPNLKIPIFTELRQDGQLYRGDPCSHYSLEETRVALITRSWCDWALFSYNGNNQKRGRNTNSKCLPGQILGFTIFDSVAYMDAFNKVCVPEDNVNSLNGGGYAITELTSQELVGFGDPTSHPIDEQLMQANSSLLFWQTKENISESGATEPLTSVKNK
jgi:hypothetical protein